MRDAWQDLVLGSRCVACGQPGRVLCPACDRALPVVGVPVRPEPAPAGLAPVHAAGWYAPPLRQLLLAHKERQVFALAAPLGRVLAGVVASAVGGAAPGTTGPGVPVLLVPVPSARRTVRARGHDPVRRMVGAAAAYLRPTGTEVLVVPLLGQRRQVADQSALGAAERRSNLAGSMGVLPARHRRSSRRLGGRPVLVVVCDDIVTTGATAAEAQRALEAVGIEVAAIAGVAATRRHLPECPSPG